VADQSEGEPRGAGSGGGAASAGGRGVAMASGLLFSIFLGTLAIPIMAAREASARGGLRKTVRNILIFEFFWVLAVAYEYPRLWH
jgi:hypothetical protein